MKSNSCSGVPPCSLFVDLAPSSAEDVDFIHSKLADTFFRDVGTSSASTVGKDCMRGSFCELLKRTK